MLSTCAENATFSARSIYMEIATACYGQLSTCTTAYLSDRDIFIEAEGIRDFMQVCAICEGVCGFECLHEGARVATYRVPVLEVRIAVNLH